MNELAESFQADGYVVLRNYLSAEEVKKYLMHSLTAAKAALRDMPEDAPLAWRLTTKGLHKHSSWFNSMAHEGEHVGLLERLLGDDLVVASCAFVDRLAGTEQGVNPHIDGAGRPFHSRAGVTLWIALDAMNEESGCLYYAGGSHRHKKEKGFDIEGYDIRAAGVSPIAVASGDAIVHHAQTVHWSGGNHTEQPRRALAFFYYGLNAPAE